MSRFLHKDSLVISIGPNLGLKFTWERSNRRALTDFLPNRRALTDFCLFTL